MKKWFGFAVVGSVVLAVEVVYFWALRLYKPDIQKTGQFGDTFGGVTALFTGLAFAGALYAIWDQNRDANVRDLRHAQQMALLQEQTKHSADMALALHQQLQVSVIATRLGVLPALIEQETLHLASNHADQLRHLRLPQRVDQATEADIEKALKQVNHIASLQERLDRGDALHGNDASQHADFGNSSRCVQRNLRDLLRYRRDMKTLYDSLGPATQTS
jgi:hypothetical protein